MREARSDHDGHRGPSLGFLRSTRRGRDRPRLPPTVRTCRRRTIPRGGASPRRLPCRGPDLLPGRPVQRVREARSGISRPSGPAGSRPMALPHAVARSWSAKQLAFVRAPRPATTSDRGTICRVGRGAAPTGPYPGPEATKPRPAPGSQCAGLRPSVQRTSATVEGGLENPGGTRFRPPCRTAAGVSQPLPWDALSEARANVIVRSPAHREPDRTGPCSADFGRMACPNFCFQISSLARLPSSLPWSAWCGICRRRHRIRSSSGDRRLEVPGARWRGQDRPRSPRLPGPPTSSNQ